MAWFKEKPTGNHGFPIKYGGFQLILWLWACCGCHDMSWSLFFWLHLSMSCQWTGWWFLSSNCTWGLVTWWAYCDLSAECR
jgi:hypothetical protein